MMSSGMTLVVVSVSTSVVAVAVVTPSVRGAVVVRGVHDSLARPARRRAVVPGGLGDDDKPGVDDAGDPAEDGEQDVD